MPIAKGPQLFIALLAAAVLHSAFGEVEADSPLNGLGPIVSATGGNGTVVALVEEEPPLDEHLRDVERIKEVLDGVDLSIPSILRHINPVKVKHAVHGALDQLTPEDAYCVRDLYDVINGTKHLQIWAISVIDAATKFPSGLLKGNLIDMGNFDECVDVKRPNYVGQHCLVRLVLDIPGLANYTVDSNGAKVPLTTVLGGTALTLTTGHCYPSTCSHQTVSKVLNELVSPINSMLESDNVTLTVKITGTDCHIRDRGPFTTEDWVVACICVMFGLLAIISTAIDVIHIKGMGKTPSTPEKFILAFSLYSNGMKLFGTESRGETMEAINGMKFFSIAWVVLGHRYRYLIQQPLTNLLDVAELLQQWTKMFILNGTLSVDTFFLISGLLNAYGFFKLVDKKRKYNIVDIIQSYIHRYIRLSPPYMLVIAITATWLYRVSDGPLWDRMVGDARDLCATKWWTNILYLNNYLTPEGNCLMQSWYLAADMQMFWLTPFVLIPMWKWPIFGLIELLILTLASIATPLAISYTYGIIQPIPITNDANEVEKEMAVLYLPMHTKTVGYVVGIFVGYLLQKARSKKIKLPLNLITCTVGWIVAGVCMLYALFGCYWLFQTPTPYSQLEASLYLGFYRFFWSVGVGWVLIVCIMGHGGFINTWLSWKPWWPLARLTYCTYLTHIAIYMIKMGSFRNPVYLNDLDLVEEYIGDLFFAMCAALVLSLLLEAPTLALEKILLGPKERKPRHPRSSGEEGQGMAGLTIEMADPSAEHEGHKHAN